MTATTFSYYTCMYHQEYFNKEAKNCPDSCHITVCYFCQALVIRKYGPCMDRLSVCYLSVYIDVWCYMCRCWQVLSVVTRLMPTFTEHCLCRFCLSAVTELYWLSRVLQGQC